MNDDHADLKTSSAPYRAEASEAGNHDGNPKPKKKICCACPETKQARDSCIAERGEEACSDLIEAHKACLRAEGFNVPL